MPYQHLTCERCWGTWTRMAQRGRPPLYCPRCKTPRTVPVYKTKPIAPNVRISDGGQKEAGIRDTNDCTVRAIAHATGKPYAEAHSFMARNGRKTGRGAFFHGIVYKNRDDILGFRFVPVHTNRSRGLKTFLLRNPQCRKGTWVVQMHHHVAALKDGVLMDSFDSSRKEFLYEAWQVVRRYNKTAPE